MDLDEVIKRYHQALDAFSQPQRPTLPWNTPAARCGVAL
jgi:hypothetical protein